MVDSTLCSDYILYMHWADEVDPVLQDKCVAHIRRRQLREGGWSIYEGGPSEVNATVKAYFALKLAGNLPSDPWMREARASALRLGGIPHMNTYAKLYLALLGQFPWKYLPTLPGGDHVLPEVVFLQHLRALFLEPRHAHAAGHPESLQADTGASGGEALARALSGRQRAAISRSAAR